MFLPAEFRTITEGLLGLRGSAVKEIFLPIIPMFAFTVQAVALELLVLDNDKSKNSKRWQEEVLLEYVKGNLGNSLSATLLPIQGRNYSDWLWTRRCRWPRG